MPKIFQFIVHGAFRLAFGVITINSGQIFNFSQEKVFYQMSCISNACDPDTRHTVCDKRRCCKGAVLEKPQGSLQHIKNF